MPNTVSGFWNYLQANGFQVPNFGQAFAPLPSDPKLTNGKQTPSKDQSKCPPSTSKGKHKAGINVDSDSSVQDEDFVGSPPKKSKDDDAIEVNSQYDELVNMTNIGSLERKVKISLNRFIIDCKQRDDTLAEELTKLGYEPKTASAQIEFFLHRLDWHGARSRTTDVNDNIKYYARDWILSHQAIIKQVPSATIISNHNFGTNSSTKFKEFKKTYATAFSTATSAHSACKDKKKTPTKE